MRTDWYWLWFVCFLLFGVAFASTAWRAEEGLRTRQLLSLLVQTGTALAMIYLVCSSLEGGLLVIVAAQLGWMLPLRRALTWVGAQAMAMCVVLGLSTSGRFTLMLMRFIESQHRSVAVKTARRTTSAGRASLISFRS